MAGDTEPRTMRVAAVVDILNRWSQEGFFRQKRLGDKIRVDYVAGRFSYSLRLRTQYEERSVHRASVPYHGGPIDDVGTPPESWSVPVTPPTDFEERTEQIPLPHTERIETCGQCNGGGNVICSPCGGFGQVTCPSCGGSGSQTRFDTITETDANGNTTTRTESVQVSCSCFSGRVPCSFCMGRGRVTCSGCNGSGKIKTFDLLAVTFRYTDGKDVLDTTDIPDKLIHQVSGETLVDARAEKIETSPAIDRDVDARAVALLQNQHILTDDTRIHFEHLQIERVGVHEVAYRYRQSPIQRLWIYGEERRVHAPDAPKAWGRIVAVVVGVLAVILAVVFAVLHFSQPPPPTSTRFFGG